MPSIIDWLRTRLEDDELADLAPGTTIAPADVRRSALRTLDDLAVSATLGLCHGDVSPWNVLTHSANGWLLIDPRGVNGEVTYDIAVLGMKVGRHRSPTVVTTRLAEAVGADRERTLAWLTLASAARV